MMVIPPTRPYRGRRDTDPAGSGVFGASRDGGKRRHLGLDLVTVPGDDIVAPIHGRIIRVGWAYKDSDLGSIHIEGIAMHDGATVKLLYAQALPNIKVGTLVEAGQEIGKAQNVTAYWDGKGVSGMTNHVHMELTMIVDPGSCMPALKVEDLIA